MLHVRYASLKEANLTKVDKEKNRHMFNYFVLTLNPLLWTERDNNFFQTKIFKLINAN